MPQSAADELGAAEISSLLAQLAAGAETEGGQASEAGVEFSENPYETSFEPPEGFEDFMRQFAAAEGWLQEGGVDQLAKEYGWNVHRPWGPAEGEGGGDEGGGGSTQSGQKVGPQKPRAVEPDAVLEEGKEWQERVGYGEGSDDEEEEEEEDWEEGRGGVPEPLGVSSCVSMCKRRACTPCAYTLLICLCATVSATTWFPRSN